MNETLASIRLKVEILFFIVDIITDSALLFLFELSLVVTFLFVWAILGFKSEEMLDLIQTPNQLRSG